MIKNLPEKQLEYSHLNLDLENLDWHNLRNPFLNYKTVEDYEEILKIVRDPRNFDFTCKRILNVEPALFQLVWLEQLWKYPFPLLVANRGASKTFTIALYYMLRAFISQGCKIVIAGAAFRQAKFVFDYMESIWRNAPVLQDICGKDSGMSKQNDNWLFKIGASTVRAIPLGNGEKIRGMRANYLDIEEFNCLEKNTLVETNKGLLKIIDAVEDKEILLLNQYGKYEKPIRFIKTPPTDVYEVTTERGYSFECSNRHKVLTTNGFKLAKDLVKGDCIVSENKYKFPIELVKSEDLIVDENLAWLMGILVAEGYVFDKNAFGVGMTDKKCIEDIKKSILKIIPGQHISYYEKDAYYDDRLECYCKKSYHIEICNQNFRNKLEFLGLNRVRVLDKSVPWSILQSPRHILLKFLQGLFYGDGCAFLWGDSVQDNRLGVCYTSGSIQLYKQVQILLKKLGYLSSVEYHHNKLTENIVYNLRLNGLYAYQLAMELNINKWQKLLEDCYEKDIEDKPTINYAKSINKFLVNTRINGRHKRVGTRKTYEDALVLYNEKTIEHLVVKSVRLLEDKQVLYDFELPETHTFYGNGMVQHNSVPEDIYEIVLRGFTVTSSNPIENIKNISKIKALKDTGRWNDKMAEKVFNVVKPNQIIISGTSGWDFQHFSKHWKKYHGIITSRGDRDKLIEAIGSEPEIGFDWKDYCIIRIPVDLLPEGMMEQKSLASSKATMDAGRFAMEFGAVFSKDSHGFFKRSLIEACTTKQPIILPSGPAQFTPRLMGDTSCKYIMGVDPASENDNFAITIEELWPDHGRLVYCWTTTRARQQEKFKGKATDENNFYAYVARKIRNLMKLFNIEYISMDAAGGGIGVMEALHDNKSLEAGEVPIWPIINESNPYAWPNAKDWGYDDEFGLHCIDMVNMSRSEYVTDANHSLRKDLENKMLLFPHIDGLSLTLAEMADDQAGNKYDNMQDLVLEIEELKEELSAIVHTTTLNGRDKWETPSIILSNNKSGKIRKDRYSSLLMCHAMARRLNRTNIIDYGEKYSGGFAKDYVGTNIGGALYMGPSWWVDQVNKSKSLGTIHSNGPSSRG